MTRSGDRVRVTAQLIHAATDRHLWARTYERELRDVLALQAEVAGAIAQAIQVEGPAGRAAPAGRAQAPSTPTRTTRTSRDASSGASARRQGIAKADRILPAGDRAGSHLCAGLFGVVGCLPHCPSMQGLRAHASACRKRRPRRARRWPWTTRWPRRTLRWPASSTATTGTGRARRGNSSVSLELDPNSAEGHRAYAIYLVTVRRHEEAVAEVRRARELSPLSPSHQRRARQRRSCASGRYDEAIEQLQKTLEIDPKFVARVRGARRGVRGTGRPAQGGGRAREGGGSLRTREAQRWLGYVVWSHRAPARSAGDTGRSSRSAPASNTFRPQHFAIVHLGLGRQGPGLGLAGEGLRGARLRDPRLLGRAVRPCCATTRGSRTCCAG